MIETKGYLPAIFLIFLLTGAFLPFGKAEAATREQIKQIVTEEAQRNGTVPPFLALAVAKVESDFEELAESSAGARGVMQIMPKTARDEFNVSAERLWDPRLNIRLGIAYLERLYYQYARRWDLALSHYNGGTLRKRGRFVAPHSYTRSYVASVRSWSRRFKRSTATVELAKLATREPNTYGDRHWMNYTQNVDKIWRHYLNIADQWLLRSSELIMKETGDTSAY